MKHLVGWLAADSLQQENKPLTSRLYNPPLALDAELLKLFHLLLSPGEGHIIAVACALQLPLQLFYVHSFLVAAFLITAWTIDRPLQLFFLQPQLLEQINQRRSAG